ncbi:MAG: 50S ribosomal protein L9 [Candidatus Colwellbacteria bacterium]
MQILLLQDIKGVGQKGQIKNVSIGYARNFLIPKGLAKLATSGDMDTVQQTSERVAQTTAKQKDLLNEVKKNTENKPVPVFTEVGKKGEMFASIREADILRALLNYEPRLTKLDARIEIEKPIKAMGKHEVSVSLGRGVRDNFTIEVEPQKAT